MSNNENIDNSVKFKVDYTWPEEGSTRNCPKCNDPMQLQPNVSEYYGKPCGVTLVNGNFLKKN